MGFPVNAIFSADHIHDAEHVSIALANHGITCQLEKYEDLREDLTIISRIPGMGPHPYVLLMVSTETITMDPAFLPFVMELKKSKTVIVFCIIGNFNPTEIPPKLRWDYFLFFNNLTNFNKSIEMIVDLVYPEAARREELLFRLKNPGVVDEYTFQELRQFALKRLDNIKNPQSIQIAAIQGLEKIGGPRSVLILTERILDQWGMNTINRAMKALYKTSTDGGIIALVATLLYDVRFYHDKIQLIAKFFEKAKNDQELSLLQPFLHGSMYTAHKEVASLFNVLENLPDRDIASAAKLARFRKPPIPEGPFDDLPRAGALESLRAMLHIEEKVPGLEQLLVKENDLLKKYFTNDEEC